MVIRLLKIQHLQATCRDTHLKSESFDNKRSSTSGDSVGVTVPVWFLKKLNLNVSRRKKEQHLIQESGYYQ